MNTLIFLPGLNSTGDIGDPEVGRLALGLSDICDKQGWNYVSPRPREMESIEEISNLLSIFSADIPDPVIIITSSFGAWPALVSLSETNGWPTQLAGLIMVSPFVSVQGIYKKLWPGVREVPRLTGFPRKGENGSKGFWVKPSMVRSMLSPENDVLDGRLSTLQRRPIKLVMTGPESDFRPNTYTTQLQEDLGINSYGVSEKQLRAWFTTNLAQLFAAHTI